MPSARYLLLEDMETGDVLMPLIYMKSVFEANYSRKLSSSRHRMVVVPPESELSNRAAGCLYWQWAFESPHNVKVVVRKELGEENTPQVCHAPCPPSHVCCILSACPEPSKGSFYPRLPTVALRSNTARMGHAFHSCFTPLCKVVCISCLHWGLFAAWQSMRASNFVAMLASAVIARLIAGMCATGGAA